MSKEINNTKTGIDLSSFLFELYSIKNQLEDLIIELEKMKEGIKNV